MNYYDNINDLMKIIKDRISNDGNYNELFVRNQIIDYAEQMYEIGFNAGLNKRN